MASHWIKARQTKYAAYATVYILIVVAVIVVGNVLADRYNKSYDATSNKRYSLSDQTAKIVKGLKQDDFRVLEQGKKQSISYFEEHTADLFTRRGQNRAFPQMPPNVFSNFSPVSTPPVVNVLLLDALNTPMADQMYLKKAAQHYLKTLKPGTRLAIFTMSM